MTPDPLVVTPMCPEIGLDRSGYVRRCVLDLDHPDDHQDARGDTWEHPVRTLGRLQAKWSHSYRIVWTGRLWMATAHSPDAPWRTEVEPTPEQLEERLRRHAHPPTPAAMRDH